MDKKPKERASDGCITVLGAREHNLKNINVTLPRNALCVVTGLSGSGKSSLAFDTIFAEGNRRYIETFSTYARGFLGGLERPDVDKIVGLSPVISIEQKTTNRNPRSTVGTTTEIYDFLRLLYARTATAYSPTTNKAMVRYTEEEIISAILRDYDSKRIYLLAPIVKDRKGHYRELLEKMRLKGYAQVRADGEIMLLTPGLSLSRYKNHRVEVLVDKLKVEAAQYDRLRESVRTALRLGKDVVQVIEHGDDQRGSEVRTFSRSLMCADSGISFADPAPHTFSFNAPQGSCPECRGLGTVPRLDYDKLIPDRSLSIAQGAIVPLGKQRASMLFAEIAGVLKHHDLKLTDPISKFSDEVLHDLFAGADYPIWVENKFTGRNAYKHGFEGISQIFGEITDEDESGKGNKGWHDTFSSLHPCPVCHGKRLTQEALSYRIDGKDIIDTTEMALPDFRNWVASVPDKIDPKRRHVALEIVKEIVTRTDFLIEVGLHYLSLARATGTLSGGETQRIRLATQIGSRLVNVLYILDEPSIGLHQRDNIQLIQSLKRLRDQGNSLIVVEHDKDMMLEADHIVDLGPGAGRKGGKVVFSGTPKEMLEADTITAQYLRGDLAIEIPAVRRTGTGDVLTLMGARGNNLKGDTLTIPLGTLTCVTGVSGSGKSSLINDTLYPILSKHFYGSSLEPLPYDAITGLEHLDKVVSVDQSPIGRMPRSNPATYTGVFTEIRNLFVSTPESRMRGYKPGRFSFNVKGGRCEVCNGNGYKRIEMNFLPDVLVPCEECKGMRYNRETLEVRFKGKSIADVLEMTVNKAVEFFENMPAILKKIKTLQEVGLGYIKLGQPSSTLSGGECQRIKLAAELSKRDTGRTIYFLDEPTTGLHFEDIRMLMQILNRLVDRGNTIVVIEHNMDVIKACDHLVDIGPEGGAAGGRVIFSGTPEALCELPEGTSYTATYLRREL